ncbi:MAG: prepilin-type N-terminal cleavage/methylation domain-containing protein [Sulfurimonas sp.]|nr:prepilin-type N-terminal cleavage/methylation domain-containing protein [Sulfurimonas sp.]
MHNKRNAFTLIEIMVAVMIVSVVIGALFTMRGNTANKFFNIKEMLQKTQYSSFLVATDNKYGFDGSNIDMQRLVDDFKVQSDLRPPLSAKVKLKYEPMQIIDTSEFDSDEQNSSTGLIFEIGKRA